MSGTYFIERCGNPRRVLLGLGGDVLMFLGTALRARAALGAENLFLRKQLASFRKRHVKPQCSPIRVDKHYERV